MAKSTRQELTNKAILLLILTAALSSIYYLANRTDIKNYKTLEKQASNTTANTKSQVSQKDILDCSKKIVKSQDLIAKGNTKSDCLFQGCGDFFQ